MSVMPISTEQRVSTAKLAWQQGARRRRRRGLAESAADALLAGGGIVMANAAFPLELGLPAGRAGLSLGAGLVFAGIAFLMRARARRAAPVPAIETRAVLPAEAWRAA